MPSTRSSSDQINIRLTPDLIRKLDLICKSVKTTHVFTIGNRPGLRKGFEIDLEEIPELRSKTVSGLNRTTVVKILVTRAINQLIPGNLK